MNSLVLEITCRAHFQVSWTGTTSADEYQEELLNCYFVSLYYFHWDHLAFMFNITTICSRCHLRPSLLRCFRYPVNKRRAPVISGQVQIERRSTHPTFRVPPNDMRTETQRYAYKAGVSNPGF